MDWLEKIWQRVTDPHFYRKRGRAFLRKWKKFDDTPRFRDWRELGEFQNVVVVIAHPDDETFCSGLLIELAEAGAEVNVACLTRGEGGPTGGGTRESLGRRREEEMRRACKTLGVSRIDFLDHVDPVARTHRLFAPDVSPADLAVELDEKVRTADIVISHGSNGEYGHPAHLLVYDAIRRIRQGRGFEGEWLTFLARQPSHPLPKLVNWDDPVVLELDVAGHTELREKAMRCHESQLGLFRSFVEGTVSDFVRKTSVETYARW